MKKSFDTYLLNYIFLKYNLDMKYYFFKSLRIKLSNKISLHKVCTTAIK